LWVDAIFFSSLQALVHQGMVVSGELGQGVRVLREVCGAGQARGLWLDAACCVLAATPCAFQPSWPSTTHTPFHGCDAHMRKCAHTYMHRSDSWIRAGVGLKLEFVGQSWNLLATDQDAGPPRAEMMLQAHAITNHFGSQIDQWWWTIFFFASIVRRCKQNAK
jgi:hypothetical protein